MATTVYEREISVGAVITDNDPIPVRNCYTELSTAYKSNDSFTRLHALDVALLKINRFQKRRS